MNTVHYTYYVNAQSIDPRQALVYGPDNMSPRNAPRIVLGDTMQIELYLLNADGTLSDASGNQDYVLKSAVGTYSGGPVCYTDNFLASGSAWTGSMSLATIELSNLLAGRDSVNAILEFELTNVAAYSASKSTVVSAPIIVSNQLIEGAFLSSGSLPDYLSVSESDARYILRTEMISASGWIPLDPNIVWTDRNVGIGINNPTTKLQVVGTVSASLFHGTFSGSVNPAAGWQYNNDIQTVHTQYPTHKVGIGVSDPYYTYGADFMVRDPVSGLDARFDAPNGEANVVISSRDFPLPALEKATLEFQHGVTPAARLYVKNENFSIMSLNTDTGSIRFTTATASVDTERMRITNIGRVGIGTPDPQALLHVQGDISCSNFLGYLQGTASHADNFPDTASYALRALTASYADYAETTGFVETASYANIAQLTYLTLYAQDAMSASYALSASHALIADFAISGTFTTTIVVSSSFASSSISASHADTASWALTASRALSCDTASAAYGGINGGFDARGVLTASLITASRIIGLTTIANQYGTVFGLNSGSINVLADLNLMQQTPLAWLGFPNLYVKPAVSPQPEFGWLRIYQSSYSQSYERFKGLRIYDADVWCNAITCSNILASGKIYGTASYADTASLYLVTQVSSSVYETSSSFASSSISASYALVAGKVFTEEAVVDGQLYPALFTGNGPDNELVWNTSNVTINPANGSITANSITASVLGNVYGTASIAQTASYIIGGAGAVITSGSSWNITASNCISASYALSASYSLSGSHTRVTKILSDGAMSASYSGSWNIFVNGENGNLVFKFL